MAPSHCVSIHNLNNTLKKKYKVVYLVSQVPGAIRSQLEITVNSQPLAANHCVCFLSS